MSNIQKRQPLASHPSNINSIINKTNKSKRVNKTLVDAFGNSSIFQLSQSQIHFINTQLNQAYQISISIRNVSENSQKIKIKHPKLQCFNLTYSKQGTLAPGLEIKLTIAFQNKNNEEVTDKIVLISQDESQIQIPIYVYPQISKLVFDPFINFGFIKIGNSKEIIFPIENIGSVSTEVKLQIHCIQQGCLKIQPQEFRVQPKQKKNIKLIITSKEAGEIDGQIQIQPKQLSLSQIDFVANFCQFNRYITNNEGVQIQQINIKPLFAGEKTQFVSHLVNNSPKSCEFRVSKKKGNDNQDISQLITPQQFGKEEAEKLLSVSPSLGQLQPYSAVELVTAIQAKFDQSDLQLFCNYTAGKIKNLPYQYKEWSYILTTYFSDQQNQQKIQLKGISVIPKISLSSSFLKFGQILLKEKSQKTLRITNQTIKPVEIKFSKSSNYKIVPEKLQLQVKQSKEVSVIFCPKIIGDSNQIITLKVGQFEFPFRVFGKGKFNANDNLQFSLLNSKVTQIKPQDLNPDYLQNQISIINQAVEKNKKQSYIVDTSNSTVHYDLTKNNESVLEAFGNIVNSRYCKQNRTIKKSLKNKNGKQVKVDVSNLDSKQQIQQFPSQTKNQQQERLIARQLNSSQLKNISVGSVVIQIGDIFLKSIQTRYFHICNFNSKPISIQFENSNLNSLPMFQNTSKNRQILPAQSYGALKIVFEALAEGQFRYPLQYILNGKHFFEIAVTGRVIQPYLSMSKSDIKFIANEDDSNFEKSQQLYLTNHHKYPVNFFWNTSKDSLFKISPQEGTLGPNSKLTIKVSHNFLHLTDTGGKVQQNLKLRVAYGKSNYLKCTSVVPQCSCVCKPQQINFKQISISKTYEQKVFLKNVGRNHTIFDVNIQKEIQGVVTVTCPQKSLHPDESVQVVVKISSSKTTLIESNITFIIRGGKHISIGIKANIIVPKIKIQQQEIDFGSTPVQGNPASKIATLINDSNIPIDLDLRLQQDSFISRCLKIGKNDDDNLSITESKDSYVFNNSNTNSPLTNTQTGIFSSNKFNVYHLKVNPKSKCNLVLQFTPQDVTNYNFFLPLFLNNSLELLPQLQKQISCKGIMNRLIASDKQVNFGKIIIEQSLQTYQKCQIIELRNPHEESIQWWIDDKGFYPFSLQKKKGKLQGGEKQTIKIFFYNDSPGQYYRQLHFFIDQTDIDISKSYLKVSVKASASYPQIYFSKPYLLMPIVNLNEQSKGKFQIINGGYENLNLKHIIVQQFSNIDIQLKYKNGSNLGVTKKKIQAQISFISDKPISFTVRVDFYDHNNRVFSIPISGTADNCIYTLLQQQLGITMHGQQIIKTRSQSQKPITNHSFNLNGLQNKNDKRYQLNRSCICLKNLINATICIQNPIRLFPSSLFDDDYQRFHQCLCFYSSVYEKMKPNWRKAQSIANRTTTVYEYFSQVIKNLKSQGAFLNQIRPQFLLPYNYYLEVLNSQAPNTNSIINYHLCSEQEYDDQMNKSWIILFYQIFKVYSRVQIPKTKNADFWAKFLLRQKTLISWLEQTYQQEAKLDQLKKTQRLRDLSDCQMISALITKYTNIKIIDFYGRPLKGNKQKEKRCRKVIQTLNQVGINTHFTHQDLLRSNPKEMLVFLQRLNMILPSYLQKGQPILFSCAFGQCLTKSVEINNPSKYPVTYIAKIQGSKAYVIQNDIEFTIESKKTHQIKVKYISNMNLNNSQATLTLSGKSSTKYTPSTFIFLLKSQTLGRISQKSVQVTGQLYESFDFNLNVTNNFAIDSQFKVELQKIDSNQKTNIVPIAFYSHLASIKIKKGQTMTLPMSFLPFCLDNQKCFILFKDPAVGEFQYEVTGIVNQPQLSQQILRIRQVLYTNKKYHIDLSIPLKNDLLVKARKLAETINENKPSDQTSKDKKLISKILNTQKNFYPKLSSKDIYTVKIIPGNQMILLKTDQLNMGDIQQTNDSLHADLSPQLQNEKQSNIRNANKKENQNSNYNSVSTAKGDKSNESTNNNSKDQSAQSKNNKVEQKKIHLEINMKYPIKDGSFILFLRNSAGTDVRKYQVLLNAVYKPLRYELQMKIPVNKVITQPLPLINLTNQNNTYRVGLTLNPITSQSTHSLHNDKNQDMIKGIYTIDCEREVLVRPKDQQVVNLSFKPRLKIMYGAVLKMENITTQQIIQYEIVGYGQEPEAELIAFDQQVRKNKSYFIKIPFSKNQKCVVNNFALQGAVYEKTFYVNYENSNFCFHFCPKKTGKFEGKLQIQDDHKIYAYRVQITVRDVIEGQFKIKTLQRKVGQAYIKLPVGQWSIIKGDPCIVSRQKFQIKDISETYKLEYYSIKPQQRTFPVTFYYEKIGQMSYNIRILVQQMPEIKLDLLKVELGKIHQQIISFQNTDATPMIIHGQSSDQNIFYFEPKNIIVGPKSEIKAKIIYRPSSLEMEEGKICFKSNKNSKWIYHMSGYGLLQAQQQIKQVQTSLDDQICQSLTFINPFNKTIKINVSMENQTQKSAFHSLLKSTKFDLSYHQEVAIPFSFKATEVKQYEALLKISISDKIFWRYLLKGKVVNKNQNQTKILKTLCRQKKQIKLQFDLGKLPQDAKIQEKNFSINIKSNLPQYQTRIQQNVKILNSKGEILGSNKICFNLYLFSLKPYQCPCEFEISDENGCKWVQKYDVCFSPPPIDDCFAIVTQLNKVASVAFRLTNKTKQFSKFKAYFTSQSCMQFTVSPKQGDLQPYGRNGTLFEVSFAPIQYRNIWNAKLIIQTDDSYWSYDVKGSLPHYNPPKGKSALGNQIGKKQEDMSLQL